MVLPLHRTGHIEVGNALRMDWLEVCPPVIKALAEEDLAGPTGRLALENEPGAAETETFVCGNPPYKGSQDQTSDQKEDLEIAATGRLRSTKSADYVIGWFLKAGAFIRLAHAKFAFVTTNSVNQGRQVASYWPAILERDLEIFFAFPSFLWRNLAARKAAVTVSVIGIAEKSDASKTIYDAGLATRCRTIGPYLVPNQNAVVESRSRPLSNLSEMEFGSMPNDGGGLLLDPTTRQTLISSHPQANDFLRPFIGSRDLIHGLRRYCIWIDDTSAEGALRIPFISDRVAHVERHRLDSDRETTKKLASTPYAFGERRHRGDRSMIVARHSATIIERSPRSTLSPKA